MLRHLRILAGCVGFYAFGVILLLGTWKVLAIEPESGTASSKLPVPLRVPAKPAHNLDNLKFSQKVWLRPQALRVNGEGHCWIDRTAEQEPVVYKDNEIVLPKNAGIRLLVVRTEKGFAVEVWPFLNAGNVDPVWPQWSLGTVPATLQWEPLDQVIMLGGTIVLWEAKHKRDIPPADENGVIHKFVTKGEEGKEDTVLYAQTVTHGGPCPVCLKGMTPMAPDGTRECYNPKCKRYGVNINMDGTVRPRRHPSGKVRDLEKSRK